MHPTGGVAKLFLPWYHFVTVPRTAGLDWTCESAGTETTTLSRPLLVPSMVDPTAYEQKLCEDGQRRSRLGTDSVDQGPKFARLIHRHGEIRRSLGNLNRIRV